MFQFGMSNIPFLLFPRIKNVFFLISNLVNINNSNIFINSVLQHRDRASCGRGGIRTPDTVVRSHVL